MAKVLDLNSFKTGFASKTQEVDLSEFIDDSVVYIKQLSCGEMLELMKLTDRLKEEPDVKWAHIIIIMTLSDKEGNLLFDTTDEGVKTAIELVNKLPIAAIGTISKAAGALNPFNGERVEQVAKNSPPPDSAS